MEHREARAFANQLIAPIDEEANSEGGHARWHAAMLDALRRVRHLLPPVASEHVGKAPGSPPALEQTVAERTALWNSIREDSMGETRRGAATRATLFLFFPYDDAGQDGAPWLFTWFYCRAGLPVDALEAAVREQWPGFDEA